MTTSFAIGSENDLNSALQQIDVGRSSSAIDTNYTFNFASGLTGASALKLTSALAAINLAGGDTLTINGNGDAIDGGGTQRGFFVYSGQVTIEDLTIQNMKAVGGAGEDGGGGGAGLGGGLYIADNTTGGAADPGAVTLIGVNFSNDASQGGAGGASGTGLAGGGGGLGGAGGVGTRVALPAEATYAWFGGGGGGIGSLGGGGIGSDGLKGSPGGSGSGGIVIGATGGGAGGGPGNTLGSGGGRAGSGSSSGGGGGGGGGSYIGLADFAGSAGGGGGGGGIGGGHGGYAGAGAGPGSIEGGGQGGYGGGGGGGAMFTAGNGGFGGGGGGGTSNTYFGPATLAGGDGGFGGGGGGGDGSIIRTTGAGGVSAFGGGRGGDSGGGGGGGLGAGGDIFVQQGASLTIESGAFSDGSVLAGLGGGGGAGSGSALGSGIFLQGDETLTLTPTSGQTVTIGDVIADQAGSAGSAGLLLNGAGTLELSAANTFVGGITVDSGTLSLGNNAAAGSGQITFAGNAGASLLIASGVDPTNMINGFDGSDTIVVEAVASAAELDSSDQLVVSDNGVTIDTLQLSGNLSGYCFAVAAISGGTKIIALPTPATIAQYLAKAALYNTVVGGVAIADTAAKITADLATLTNDVSSVAAITLTSGGPISVRIVNFENYHAALAKIVGGFTISDIAANIEALTSTRIAALKASGANAIVSTSGGLTLSVAQALALEGPGLKISVPEGDFVTLSAAGTAIAALTTAEIAALGGIGVGDILSKSGGVTLSAAQTLALEGGGLKLSVPTGDSAIVRDGAAAIEALTAAQIAALARAGINGFASSAGGLALSVAQAIALENADLKPTVPKGDSIVVSDTAKAIATISTATIARLATIGATGVVSTDKAVLALSQAQALALDAAHLKLSVSKGYYAELVSAATHIDNLTVAEIDSLAAIGIRRLFSNGGNVLLSVAQTSAVLSLGLTATAASPYSVTEKFADGSSDATFANISGKSYSSYEDIFNSAKVEVAVAEDNAAGGGGILTLHGGGLTFSASSGHDSILSGSDRFAINPHTSETIVAKGETKETLAFSAGFGHDAISGFAVSGAGHDVVELAISMFSYLNSSMTQAHDLAALINHASQNGGNTTITDTTAAKDTLTLDGVGIATLLSNGADFKFV
jgi:hypothetical protein